MLCSRLAEPDLELILPRRNAPAVGRAMYTHHEISADEYHAWVKRITRTRAHAGLYTGMPSERLKA
jgi:hypothetical protein